MIATFNHSLSFSKRSNFLVISTLLMCEICDELRLFNNLFARASTTALMDDKSSFVGKFILSENLRMVQLHLNDLQGHYTCPILYFLYRQRKIVRAQNFHVLHALYEGPERRLNLRHPRLSRLIFFQKHKMCLTRQIVMYPNLPITQESLATMSPLKEFLCFHLEQVRAMSLGIHGRKPFVISYTCTMSLANQVHAWYDWIIMGFYIGVKVRAVHALMARFVTNRTFICFTSSHGFSTYMLLSIIIRRIVRPCSTHAIR